MLLRVLIVTAAVSGSLAQIEGDTCRLLPRLTAGVCRSLHRCVAARLSSQRGVEPQLCPRSSLVCCPAPRTAPRVTSTRMCREYTQLAWKRERSPVLMLDDSNYYTPKCGLQGSSPLIIGGTQAQQKEFPHMAAIGFGEKNDSIMWVCGGTLISEWFVLTAGHCVQDPSGQMSARWVLLGDLSLDDDRKSTNRQLLGVAERIAHPQYRRPIKYNDIALLRLERAARLGSHVRPACLNTRTSIAAKKAIATGWGKVSDEQLGSDDLMNVELTIQPTEQCQKTFNVTATPTLRSTLPEGIQEESMLCAGELAGGKDTCQGDSGGPLQVPMDEHHCMYSIVGVTSFGKSCARPNNSAVYTRVSHYITWIENIAWNSNEPAEQWENSSNHSYVKQRRYEDCRKCTSLRKGYNEGAMEKISTSESSLKLFRQSVSKSKEVSAEVRHPESVCLGTETETAKGEALLSEDVAVESATFCELRPTEIGNVGTESVEGEQAGGNSGPSVIKQVPEDEIADIFLPDSREVAVVVSWNWDSSQRNCSPKSEKTKSSTPVGQKRRSSKISSPLMRAQPTTRRKRILKKELTSCKSSFVSELRALSEKLQKAKEHVQTVEDAGNDENELCFELSNPTTEELKYLRQEHTAFRLESLEKIKNDSFRTLLADVDDDCLIQCSQEVEKSLQECASPLKKSPKLQNLGTVKHDKISPNRTKTPSKVRVLNNNPPRRSPRIRNQNSASTHSEKSRSNVKRGDADRLLDEDLVESLLDDEIELLSQIPSPSAILRAEKHKPNAVTNTRTLVNMPMPVRNKSQQMLAKQSGQQNVNGIVNLSTNASCATSAQCMPLPVKDSMQFSEKTRLVAHSHHPAVGTVKPATSFTAKKYSTNCSSIKTHSMPANNVLVVNKQEKVTANSCKNSPAGIEDDDSFGDPALCNLLDSVESSVLSSSLAGPSSPLKNGEKNLAQQQISSSPPLQCTPEEIEKKKREALERRMNHSRQGSSLSSRSMHSRQNFLLQEDEVKVQLQVPNSPPRRYTPEEIEKKRLEALQIKRQQSLFRSTTRSSGPRQRLYKK